jgi:hypothetical protein
MRKLTATRRGYNSLKPPAIRTIYRPLTAPYRPITAWRDAVDVGNHATTDRSVRRDHGERLGAEAWMLTACELQSGRAIIEGGTLVRRFTRPSGATVIAGIALFVSLGGGAYAAASGSVTHSQLAPNSVWHANIGNGSVQANNLSADLRKRLPPLARRYGVANVLVSHGGGAPAVLATYSGALESPIVTTIGGAVSFTCTQAQGPCKVSIAAAVLAPRTDTLGVHATVLITRQVTGSQPDMFCEYAQDADNSHMPATVRQVLMSTTAASITTPLPMGVGGSLDCNAGQPYSPSVTDIWVPGGTTPTSPSYYTVETTFQFLT